MSKTARPSPTGQDTPEPPPLTARQATGPVAAAVRLGDVEREKIARRNLAEASIASAVERALAKSPPLTPAQLKRIGQILRAGGVR